MNLQYSILRHQQYICCISYLITFWKWYSLLINHLLWLNYITPFQICYIYLWFLLQQKYIKHGKEQINGRFFSWKKTILNSIIYKIYFKEIIYYIIFNKENQTLQGLNYILKSFKLNNILYLTSRSIVSLLKSLYY